jgi:hypothetical protein
MLRSESSSFDRGGALHLGSPKVYVGALTLCSHNASKNNGPNLIQNTELDLGSTRPNVTSLWAQIVSTFTFHRSYDFCAVLSNLFSRPLSSA